MTYHQRSCAWIFKSEIVQRLETLSPEQQRQLLSYLNLPETSCATGEIGKNLLPFAGTLDDKSAAEMTEAIDSACETVDLHEWSIPS